MKKVVQNLISAQQFSSSKQLEDYFLIADKLKKNVNKVLRGKIIACLFYEPSTRTRFSFESACLRLGAQVISSENAGSNSSAAKGETIEDTIKVIENYADAIIIRHPESGICEKAVAVASVPIINAGDGSNEHPTQAMLDVYTMRQKFGKIDGLKIALVGDLLYGRTVHSLVGLLSLYDNVELYLVSPKKLALPKKFKEVLINRKIKFTEQTDLTSVLSKIDILYMTRIQKERFKSAIEYNKYANSYRVDKKALEKLNKDAIIMHPLPRVNEINPEVDADKRSYYFIQAQNGLYVRMAILSRLLGSKK